MNEERSLQARLEELERSNRRLRHTFRVGGLVAGAAFLTLLASGFATSGDAVTASEFRLVQGDIVRASLWSREDAVGLTLRDASGDERVELLATELESILTFRDGAETRRVVLTTGHNDHGLYFMDPDGKDRVSLIALDQQQSLTMRDRSKATRIGLVVSDDDQGLYLMDRQGKDNVSLVTTDGDEGLFFRNDRGLYVVRDGEDERLQLVTGE